MDMRVFHNIIWSLPNIHIAPRIRLPLSVPLVKAVAAPGEGYARQVGTLAEEGLHVARIQIACAGFASYDHLRRRHRLRLLQLHDKKTNIITIYVYTMARTDDDNDDISLAPRTFYLYYYAVCSIQNIHIRCVCISPPPLFLAPPPPLLAIGTRVVLYRGTCILYTRRCGRRTLSPDSCFSRARLKYERPLCRNA